MASGCACLKNSLHGSVVTVRHKTKPARPIGSGIKHYHLRIGPDDAMSAGYEAMVERSHPLMTHPKHRSGDNNRQFWRFRAHRVFHMSELPKVCAKHFCSFWRYR